MKPDQGRELLRAALDELSRARVHLDYSARRVADLPEDFQSVDEDLLESVEAFCSRFARTVDLLVNKVLRGLDRAELQAPGTLIDVVNRAEKRGLVEHAEILREMKDLRNIIALDYAGARLAEVFAWCRVQKPVLDAICNRTVAYVQELLHSTGNEAR